MGVLQIISGVVLILCSIVIVVLVMMQSAKGNGLAGAIGGGEMMMGEGQSRSTDALMAKITKIAGVVFFVVAIAVSIFSALNI